jgi:hypothetical protein
MADDKIQLEEEVVRAIVEKNEECSANKQELIILIKREIQKYTPKGSAPNFRKALIDKLLLQLRNDILKYRALNNVPKAQSAAEILYNSEAPATQPGYNTATTYRHRLLQVSAKDFPVEDNSDNGDSDTAAAPGAGVEATTAAPGAGGEAEPAAVPRVDAEVEATAAAEGNATAHQQAMRGTPQGPAPALTVPPSVPPPPPRTRNEKFKFFCYILTHNEQLHVFKFGYSGAELNEFYAAYRRAISESYMLRVIYLKDKNVSFKILMPLLWLLLQSPVY